MNALVKVAGGLGRAMGEAGVLGAGLGFGLSKLHGHPTESALANALASAGLSAGATGALNLPAHLRYKRYLKELEQQQGQEKTASLASAIGELPTHEKAMLGAGAAGVAGGLGGLTYLAHKYPGVAYPVSYGILGGKVGGRAGWKMGPRDDHDARQMSAAAGGTLGALAGIRAGRIAGKKYIEERDRKKRLKEQQGQEKTAFRRPGGGLGKHLAYTAAGGVGGGGLGSLLGAGAGALEGHLSGTGALEGAAKGAAGGGLMGARVGSTAGAVKSLHERYQDRKDPTGYKRWRAARKRKRQKAYSPFQ